MKATYGEVLNICKGLCQKAIDTDFDEVCIGTCQNVECREIFKDPITDSGEKKSTKGLIRVDYNEQGKVTLYDQQTKEQEDQGLLKIIFLDGKLIKQFSLTEVRNNLKNTA